MVDFLLKVAKFSFVTLIGLVLLAVMCLGGFIMLCPASTGLAVGLGAVPMFGVGLFILCVAIGISLALMEI